MNLRTLVSLCCTMILAAAAGDDMAIKNQETKTFKKRASAELSLEYLLFLPEGYKQDDAKRWPLMLFLHGAGERGTNIAKVAVHGPPKIVKNRPDFPFILVSPQCPAGQTWDDDLLLALLDYVTEQYRVDESRIYLTGLSMGGFATWSLGLKYPDRFAAIAPICGGGSILPALLPKPGKEGALKKLPVWAFHGGKDNVVPLEESERMIKILERAGNHQAKLTVDPEAGHDSWTKAYENQELYDWFLKHTRSKSNVTREKMRRQLAAK